MILGAAAAMIFEPVATEPVNAIMSVPGCSTSRDDPSPAAVTTLKTPAGRWEKTSPSRSVASGVSSLGLTMHVLPAARAAAPCQASRTIG